MEVGSIQSASTRHPTLARSGAAWPGPAAAVRPADPPADNSRLLMVVGLIERLTGREVRLVPPTAYIVTAPSTPAPPPPAVEIVVATDLTFDRDPPGSELVVDVTELMHDGLSNRVILGTNPQGGLALFSGVNLEL